MKTLMMAGAAALALTITPAMAQSQAPAHQHGSMTSQQMMDYESWPQDRQAQYDRWPEDQRNYYWTLTPDQQLGWWVLNDEQRQMLFSMPPEQRAQAWTSINEQMRTAGAAQTTSPTRSAPMSGAATSGNVRFVSNGMVQQIPADQASPGEIPICGPNEYDNCMNAWEAGRRGPNVTKPLESWPGSTGDNRAGE